MIRLTREAVGAVLLMLLASGLAVAQDTFDFGGVQVGTTATSTYTFRVTEGSAGQVTATEIVFSNGLPACGPFELSDLPTFPATLEAGDSISLQVTFTPTAEGTHAEEFTIFIRLAVGSTPQTKSYTVTATGRGDAAGLWGSVRAGELGPDGRDLVAGNTAFAFDVYREIRSEEGNLLFSPYSISSALAMTYAGARGETEAQMADALHFPLPQGDLHPAFQTLSAILASRSANPDVTLDVANSLWLQTGYSFLDAYLALLGRHYETHPERVDFVHAPVEAADAINEWVHQATRGMIEEVLDPREISADTVLRIVNAIYFKADWAAPFPTEGTRARPFYLLDGREILVPTMEKRDEIGYANGEGYHAVELPYSGGTLSLVVLIPREGPRMIGFGPSPLPVTGPIDPEDFAAFERSLNADRVASILAGLRSTLVELVMPKFAYESRYALEPHLRSLGMPDAFTPYVANLSGIDGTQLLFLSEATHAARIAVDEEGTVAAAATAIGAIPVGLPPEPVPVVIDCPFVFLIRDCETGAILFVGRVVDPRG